MTTARDRLYWAQKERAARIDTVEIYHPVSGVLRFALRQFSDITATLEATAPRNPSEQVLFTAVAGSISPRQQSSGVVTRNLTFSSIGTSAYSYISQLTGIDTIKTPIELIYRSYIASELTQPSNTPELYEVKPITIGERVELTATDKNPRGKRFARLFRSTDFEGLNGFI